MRDIDFQGLDLCTFLQNNYFLRSTMSVISSSSWIVIFIGICVSGSAMARGGRLNSEGCHNDNARAPTIVTGK